MRNRSIGLTLFGGLAILVAACGGGATPSPSASTAPVGVRAGLDRAVERGRPPSGAALKPIKVGVVTDVGQLEDKSFNQSLE